MFKPREIAKHAAHLVMSANANAIITDQITRHTDHAKDDISVRVVSGVGGEIVAGYTDSFTDRLVDNVADRFAARKARKEATK